MASTTEQTSQRKGWIQVVVEEDELIDGIIEFLNYGWVARLTCGFEEINGERRLVSPYSSHRRRASATLKNGVRLQKPPFSKQ